MKVISICMISLCFLFSYSSSASSVQNGFIVFSSQQEALDWYGNFETGLASTMGKPSRKIYPISDARYAPLKNKVVTLWNGFRKSFADKVNDLPAPEVVLIEDAEKNAYAVFDGASKSYPLLFVIHTGILSITDEEQFGVFAHEIGHLVFKHGISEIQDNIKIYYKITSALEPLGFLQKTDPDIKSLVSSVLDLTGKVGPYPLSELQGVPLDIWGQARYTRLLLYSKMAYARIDRADCVSANLSFQKMIDSEKMGLNYGTQNLILSNPQSYALKTSTTDFISSFRKCVLGIKPDLAGIMAAQYGVDPNVISSALDRDEQSRHERDRFDGQNNLMDSFRAVTQPLFSQLKILDEANDLSKIRIYTHEEQADEISIKVMLALGMNPENNAHFLMNLLSPGDRRDCMATVGHGEVPGYGTLSDPHHSSCYRIYHSSAFTNYLQLQKN